MTRPADIIRGTLILGIALGLAGWWLWRCLKRSEEPVGLIGKWLITALLIPALFLAGGTGPYMPIYGALVGAVMALVWTRSITHALSKPFINIFTGGETPPEPRPFYSVAESKRKKGQFHEAVFEIHEQLKKFPNDLICQIMLAEIQAENLNDLPGAQLTIDRLCEQRGHAPESMAIALNRLADWHLRFGQDIPAAHQTLQRIIEMFPDTEPAQLAAHRIAHLGTTESLLASHDRRAIPLRVGAHNVGLLKDSSSLRKPQEDLAAKAAEYVKHLEAHPLDSETREKLALLYAEHYQRLDLASDQLEQLIEQPNQPAKQKARWLNLLASLHIQHGHDYELARNALQRIIDSQAGTALAAQAEQRLAHLKLDLKGREETQAVKLGTYEQNLGLKTNRNPNQDRQP